MWRNRAIIPVPVILAGLHVLTAPPTDWAASLMPEQVAIVREHVFGGVPSAAQLLVRTAYVQDYDDHRHMPRWVAYRITPDAYEVMDRDQAPGFRNDPDVAFPIRNEDWVHWEAERGFERGHLAPYAIMGGDRDGDGLYASDGDPEDIRTIMEGNYRSNLAPQHEAFNGAGGLWYELEAQIRERVKDGDIEPWVIAGPVFGPGETEGRQVKRTMGGDTSDDAFLFVPPAFFKIVILQDDPSAAPTALAFLFPHQRLSHGRIQDYLVTVDLIESLTGLDFLNELDDEVEAELEDTDSWANWVVFSDED